MNDVFTLSLAEADALSADARAVVSLLVGQYTRYSKTEILTLVRRSELFDKHVAERTQTALEELRKTGLIGFDRRGARQWYRLHRDDERKAAAAMIARRAEARAVCEQIAALLGLNERDVYATTGNIQNEVRIHLNAADLLAKLQELQSAERA